MEKHGHRIDMSSLSADGSAAASKEGATAATKNGPKVALVAGLFAVAGAIYYFNPLGERASTASTNAVTLGGGAPDGAAATPTGMSTGGDAEPGEEPRAEAPLPRGGSTHPSVPDPNAEDPEDDPPAAPPPPPPPTDGGGQ